jgi:hypothetical protein
VNGEIEIKKGKKKIDNNIEKGPERKLMLGIALRFSL